MCRRERSGLLRGAPAYQRSNSQSTTKEILELKDHLVQVERTVSIYYRLNYFQFLNNQYILYNLPCHKYLCNNLSNEP